MTHPSKILCTLLLSLLALGPIASAQDQAQPQQDPQDEPVVLTPLTIGNTWRYHNSDSNTITTDTVVGMVLFNDQPWYLLRTIEVHAKSGDVVYQGDLWIAHFPQAETDALATLNQDTQALELTNISQTFRYDVEQGQTYQPEPTAPTRTVEVVAVDQQIQTPAGEFTCVVYEQTDRDDPGFIITFYVAPGIGIVRTVTIIDQDQIIGDLLEYSLVEDEDE